MHKVQLEFMLMIIYLLQEYASLFLSSLRTRFVTQKSSMESEKEDSVFSAEEENTSQMVGENIE